MADILYLNKGTRDNMKLARRCILKTYEMVRQGRDKAALRYANRAVDAYELAMKQARQPEPIVSYIPFFSRTSSVGDAA